MSYREVILFFCGLFWAQSTNAHKMHCSSAISALGLHSAKQQRQIYTVLEASRVKELDILFQRFTAIQSPSYRPELEGLTLKEIALEIETLAPLMTIYLQLRNSLEEHLKLVEGAVRNKNRINDLLTLLHIYSDLDDSFRNQIGTFIREEREFSILGEEQLKETIELLNKMMFAFADYKKKMAEFFISPPELVWEPNTISEFRDRELDFFVRNVAVSHPHPASQAQKFSWSRYAKKVLVQLHALNDSKTLDEVKKNCGGLKHYKETAKYSDYFAVELDKQFRVLFKWKDNKAIDVHIADYHGA